VEKILCYALNRIVELENMLLPAIPETVWPAEVELIFSHTERARPLADVVLVIHFQSDKASL
ncbi:hypothetical protein KUX74_22730, partial [Salmonella enterica subsp. enterica serovar Montevideo]|nr:hypothetical protein [Salmonella enterica subsp. enterica serovar Montevideo]